MPDELTEHKETTIVIQTHRHEWACGDGCCSSSWYEGSLSVDGSVLFEVDSENSMDEEQVKTRLLESYITQMAFGLSRIDYVQERTKG